MEKQILYNDNMHFEHQRWKREIAFWKDESKFFNNRLSELITRWANKDMNAQIGHYQNQFIVHGGVIDDLLEAIEQHETHMAAQFKAGNDELDTHLSKKHIELRDQMETQREIYAELKKEFFKFLEKHL